MPFGYTAAHCEWLAKYAYSNSVGRPSTFEVLLYDDSVDELGFHDDLTDISSEPDDGNYQRATLSFPGDVMVSMDDRGSSVVPISATFDFQGVTGEVDSVGIAWQAQLEGEGERHPHLMVREQLAEREDLSDRKGQYVVDPSWRLESRY